MAHPKKKSELWVEGKSKKEPITANNMGWKLLEKMGWQHGRGLGKNNQGMTENPLWKQIRDVDCKSGLKTKEEVIAQEALVHQNAFDDLLDELNAHSSEDNVKSVFAFESTSQDTVPVSKRPTRYSKMAQAKDVNNYSVKDIQGIIGVDVTKKNFSSLLEFKKESKTMVETRSHKSFVSHNTRSRKKNKVFQSGVQKFKSTLDAFDETERTVESRPYINDTNDSSSPVSDSKKKIKRKYLLGECSSKNDISTECIPNSDTSCVAKHSMLGKVESKVKNTKTRRNKEENFETHSSASDLCASLGNTTLKKRIRMDDSSEDADCGENEINEQLLQKPPKVHNICYSDHNYALHIPSINTKDGNLSTKSKCSKLEEEFCRKDKILTETDADNFEKEKPKRNTRQQKSRNNNEVNVSNNTLQRDMDMKPSNSSSCSQNVQSIAEIRQVKENSTKGDGQELCEKLTQDDVLIRISLGFIGSNLNAIRGYGNW